MKNKLPPLPGAEHYNLPEPTRRKARSEEIEMANKLIPIQEILYEMFGMVIPRDLVKSEKARCPLGFEHPDAGIERAMRVYPSNTAYCFSTHGALSPVRLASIFWSCSHLNAARRLVKQYELTKPREHYTQKMDRLILEDEKHQTSANVQAAVEALQTFLSQDSRYNERQFDPDVTELMEALLEELDAAVAERQPGAIREWFQTAKTKATEFLDAT